MFPLPVQITLFIPKVLFKIPMQVYDTKIKIEIITLIESFTLDVYSVICFHMFSTIHAVKVLSTFSVRLCNLKSYWFLLKLRAIFFSEECLLVTRLCYSDFYSTVRTLIFVWRPWIFQLSNLRIENCMYAKKTLYMWKPAVTSGHLLRNRHNTSPYAPTPKFLRISVLLRGTEEVEEGWVQHAIRSSIIKGIMLTCWQSASLHLSI